MGHSLDCRPIGKLLMNGASEVTTKRRYTNLLLLLLLLLWQACMQPLGLCSLVISYKRIDDNYGIV